MLCKLHGRRKLIIIMKRLQAGEEKEDTTLFENFTSLIW